MCQDQVSSLCLVIRLALPALPMLKMIQLDLQKETQELPWVPAVQKCTNLIRDVF